MPEQIVYEVWIPENEYLVIKTESKNPERAIRNIASYYRKYYEVKTAKVWEKETRYDISGTPGFFVRIDITPEFPDRYVQITFENIFEGEMPAKEGGYGNITIKIRALLRIVFSYTSTIEKFFYFLYYYLFYKHQKDKYIKEIREILEKVKNHLIEDLTK